MKAQHKHICRMNYDKHAFEGYAIRMMRKGVALCAYLTACKSKTSGNKNARYKKTLDDAIKLRDDALAILDNKRSWRKGDLTKKAKHSLQARGFTVSHYQTRAKAKA